MWGETMGEYIFSISEKTYKEIKDKLDDLNILDEKYGKSLDENEIRNSMRMVDKLKDIIEQTLLDAGERNEPLITIEDELNEGRIVINFKRYFARQDHSMINIRQGPLDPEAVKEYWKKLTNFIENEDGKKKVIQYCIETEDYDYTNDQIESIFNKWISILNHAAENGNWFYHHVNLE